MIYRFILFSVIGFISLTHAEEDSQLENTALVNYDFSFLPEKVSELDGEVMTSAQLLNLMGYRLARLNSRLFSVDELKIFSVKFIEEHYEREVQKKLAHESGLFINLGIAEYELKNLEKKFGNAALMKQFEFTGQKFSEKVVYYAETKLMKEYFEKEILLKNPVNEAEALEFYFDNESQFYRKESVKIAQIFVSYLKAEERDLALDKIKEAMQKLTSGEQFSKVAKDYSMLKEDDGTTGNFFTKEELRPELRSSFDLSVGSFSQVIESNHGFHIIKVLERKAAGQQSFDTVKDNLIKQMSLQRSQKVLHQRIVERMKKGGFKLYIK